MSFFPLVDGANLAALLTANKSSWTSSSHAKYAKYGVKAFLGYTSLLMPF